MTPKINLEKRFIELLDIIAGYNPKADVVKIKKAWAFAKLAHYSQKRLSGEPFVTHPLEVAVRLAKWHLDTTSIIVALLHDTVEDGGATRADLVKEFGGETAMLVDGVTKVTDLRLKGSEEQSFVENLRKMLLVMAKDLRVVLVKLADRLHNMETLYALTPKKQIDNARETLEIYAPLAERLGMGNVKGQLEDLAFPYVYPKKYNELLTQAEPYYQEVERDIQKMKKTLHGAFLKEHLKVEIQGRKKHYYSLWRKLERPEIDWDFAKIYDIVALRVIVDTVTQCYSALGVIHSQFKPVPSMGVSDFIAQPKPNGYKSIHTRVFGPGGRIVEVQIRTCKMQEEADSGVAAHWAYGELKTQSVSGAILEKLGVTHSQQKLGWVKQLVNWQKEITDSTEFLRVVKFDAFKHRNFVFSPKGDVFDLPAGATPVDFAFAVHTDLGKSIAGAKVDGKIVSLNYQLKSGQVVEILKSKNPKGPNRDWLEFVVTTLARREINKQLRNIEAKG